MNSAIKEEILKTIEKNRPKLSKTSKTAYVSTLSSLYRRLSRIDDRFENDFFKQDPESIIEQLSTKKPQARKSVLSALYILTNDDRYRTAMVRDCKTSNEMYKNQSKSEKQVENWIGIETIQDIYKNLLDKASSIISKKVLGNQKSIMDFLLIALLGGVSGLPPRRSLDYGLMKIKNYDPKSDNYYKAGKFHFNVYKTCKKYGEQTLIVPPALDKMIKKWIKLNPTDYLLYSSNEKPLSSPQISIMLNKIFGKRVSTDMLRHIFLTDKYKNIPSIREMESLATDMGHSVGTALEYVKKH